MLRNSRRLLHLRRAFAAPPTFLQQQQSRLVSSKDLNKPGWDRSDMEEKIRSQELTYRETDHITFDPKNIRQEPDEEREAFDKYLETYGHVQFGKEERKVNLDRDFTKSKDAAEWGFVERLLKREVIPPVPEKDSYPSGFVPAKRQPGDLPYHVYRTKHHMLPVYGALNRKDMILSTCVRKVDGDLFNLRDELDIWLDQRYGMNFMSQVAEVYGKVTYRGDFEEDFKEFLINKGF